MEYENEKEKGDDFILIKTDENLSDSISNCEVEPNTDLHLEREKNKYLNITDIERNNTEINFRDRIQKQYGTVVAKKGYSNLKGNY